MKILIAPDKFKGSLPAPDAATAIAAGILHVDPSVELELCPLADGGEGTVSALVAATNGRLITRSVIGPLPQMKVQATFGFLGDRTTAVIEMAAASGLALLDPPDRNPLNTTTFGTGQLIAAAIQQGARKIILGIGGSATIDAGIGCAQACGFTVLLRDGEQTSITEPLCGRDLQNVLMIKHGRGEITSGIEIHVACDVTHPLFGPNGAAEIFGPQKGATPTIVKQLDTQLQQFAQRTGTLAQAQSPGAGAAGGLGFGLLAFFGATLNPGFNLVADAVHLRQKISNADLCITGEGQLDSQSADGKVVGGMSRLCQTAGIPCIALVGSIADDADRILSQGLTACFSICDKPMSLDTARQNAPALLAKTAANCLKLWKARK